MDDQLFCFTVGNNLFPIVFPAYIIFYFHLWNDDIYLFRNVWLSKLLKISLCDSGLKMSFYLLQILVESQFTLNLIFVGFIGSHYSLLQHCLCPFLTPPSLWFVILPNFLRNYVFSFVILSFISKSGGFPSIFSNPLLFAMPAELLPTNSSFHPWIHHCDLPFSPIPKKPWSHRDRRSASKNSICWGINQDSTFLLKRRVRLLRQLQGLRPWQPWSAPNSLPRPLSGGTSSSSSSASWQGCALVSTLLYLWHPTWIHHIL